MMTIAEACSKLEHDYVFKVWKQENTESYLAHVFIDTQYRGMIIDIGYCNPDQTITTFRITEKQVIVSKPEEVLKQNDAPILPLSKEEVITTLAQALETAEHCQKTKYPKSTPIKKFIVLQHLPIGQGYNITYDSQTKETVNKKICAKTGATLEEHALTRRTKTLCNWIKDCNSYWL